MATLTNIVDRVTKWADENICQKVLLKVPPNDSAESDDKQDNESEKNEKSPTGAGYPYQEVHPACFPLFVPTGDKLPPKVNAPIPSMCIRIIDGEDGTRMGSINLEMCFSVWNPGTHGRDILKPTEKPMHYEEWEGSEAEAYFNRSASGWRDVWNWIDTALRELESTISIDGLQIDREKGIKYGPLKEDEGIPDYYPFWFAYISFSLKRPIVRNVKQYENFL